MQSKWISGKDSAQSAVLQNCQYLEHFDYDNDDHDDDDDDDNDEDDAD